MNKIYRLLLVFIPLAFSGCSSLTEKPYRYSLREPSLLCGSDPCDWANHVLAINGRGKLKPIEFSPSTTRSTDANKQIEQVLQAIRKSGKKQLLVFIHGGMNSYEDSLARVEEDLPTMTNDPINKNTYPIFILWPTGPFDSYGDSLSNYYQGTWDHPSYSWGLPITFATDIMEIGVRSVLSYGKQTNSKFGSLCYSEYWRDAWFYDCGPNPNSPKSGTTVTKDERNPTYDPCVERNPIGFRCITSNSDVANQFDLDSWKYAFLWPFKLLTIPVVDPLGYRAWNSMISRTRFAMRHPCKDDVYGDEESDCQAGEVYKLFQAIERDDYLNKLEILMIGHSMGAIVANSVVKEFPNLAYRNIVFLGAALSVRDFQNGIERILYDRVKDLGFAQPKGKEFHRGVDNQVSNVSRSTPFYFYSVSLHPYAEATEENYLGAVPTGSLLEWIDHNFEMPADMGNRTLGRWANLAPLRYTFNQFLIDNGYVHFKRFGLDESSPHTHGDLAKLRKDGEPQYWNPKYWF